MVTLRQLYTVFGHDERWRKFATACTQPMVAVYLRKLGDTAAKAAAKPESADNDRAGESLNAFIDSING